MMKLSDNAHTRAILTIKLVCWILSKFRFSCFCIRKIVIVSFDSCSVCYVEKIRKIVVEVHCGVLFLCPIGQGSFSPSPAPQ